VTATSLLSKLLLAAAGLTTVLAQSTPRAIESASLRAVAWRDDRSAAAIVQAFGSICDIGAMSPGGFNVETHRPYISGNQLNLNETSLCQLIAMAYDIAGFRISGAP